MARIWIKNVAFSKDEMWTRKKKCALELRRCRVRPRFFDQVKHETMYAPSGKKQFFTESCHPQTYQNYEQLWKF